MWHESSEGVELFVPDDEYQRRHDDSMRASRLRNLRCVLAGYPPLPEPSGEVADFLDSMGLGLKL